MSETRVLDLSLRDPKPLAPPATKRRASKDTRAVPGLIVTLDDHENALRGLAAAALAELGDQRAAKPLRGALKWAGKDDDLRHALTSALGSFGEKT